MKRKKSLIQGFRNYTRVSGGPRLRNGRDGGLERDTERQSGCTRTTESELAETEWSPGKVYNKRDGPSEREGWCLIQCKGTIYAHTMGRDEEI